MSYLVTRLVRAARLPATLANRPNAKAILLALADDCGDDGRGAFPSLATLAREAEVCRRTVQGHLKQLQAAGLIVEQRRPSQHRPRTWSLHLAQICALAEVQAVARLSESDRQLVAELRADPFLPLESEVQAAAPLDDSEVQPVHPEVQAAAPERYERYRTNASTAAQTPRFTRQAKDPNGDNFHVIRKLAIEVLQATGQRGADLVETVKEQCGALRIDYGRHAAVPFNVVHRACAWAELQLLKATRARIRDDVHPRRRLG